MLGGGPAYPLAACPVGDGPVGLVDGPVGPLGGGLAYPLGGGLVGLVDWPLGGVAAGAAGGWSGTAPSPVPGRRQ